MERPGLRAALPILGGGVHPGLVATFVEELGTDIVLGVGGAVQGHPDGATSGVRAMRQAVSAAVDGVEVEDAALDHPELAGALQAWGGPRA